MTAKEIINDFKENYTKVKSLMEDDAAEEEPFKSMYKAKDILQKMHESLIFVPRDTDLYRLKIDAMIGTVLLNIGIIDMDTDDYNSCEKALTEAETLLLPNAIKPEIIIPLITVENYLGILWANRDVPEKAKTYLLKSKEIYDSFKCTMQMPISIEHIIQNNDSITGDIMLLEKPHTLTLYYLAQVYGSLQESLKSAIYCHVTLRRQLQYNDYNPIEWSLNSATLSQFFAEKNGFYQSRHHLAAASTILDQYEEKLNENDTNDEAALAERERFNHRSADVARCWAKYCIFLMTASRDRLMKDPDDLEEAITDLSNLQLEDYENICGGDTRNLIFPDLDVSKYENKVGYKYLLTYQDAREVFLNCQSWLNKAKEYYKPDTLASDYIQLVQDSSMSYCHLAFFEEDDERRAKIHKRRVDIIENLLGLINPTYYMKYCQQLWYELAEVYAEILDIKLEKANSSGTNVTLQMLRKINVLCEKSIENYKKFLNSIKNKDGEYPKPLEDELIRPVVCANAHIGRNSMKRIAVDKQTQLDHIMMSFDAYQEVVDICTNNENAAKMMSVQFSLCQEMVKILSIKIRKIQSELAAES